MGVPTSDVGYTSAMPRREDQEVRKGHVGALGEKKNIQFYTAYSIIASLLPSLKTDGEKL